MTRDFPPQTRHRADDRVTSRDAAYRIASAIKPRQQVVLGLLRQHGPMTDEELTARLRALGCPWGQSTARTRRAELVELGWVERTDQKRLTATGSPSWVWRAV